MGAGKAADLTYWEGAARTIASVSKASKIIVEKSTVPVKTAEAIEKVLRRNCADPSVHFEILSNPEFLAEVLGLCVWEGWAGGGGGVWLCRGCESRLRRGSRALMRAQCGGTCHSVRADP